MALDLIKEYLVGIGFNVDLNSLNSAEQSMSSAEKTIQNFNNNSNKGFSETSDSLNGLFELLRSSSGTFGKLFPELQTPFKSLIRDIILVKKLYNDLTNSKKEEAKPKAETDKFVKPESTKSEPPSPKTKSKIKNEYQPKTEPKTKNKYQPKAKIESKKSINALTALPKNTELADNSKNLIENILNAKEASQSLAVEGGNAFKAFATSSLGSIAAIVAGVAVFALATKALIASLNDLAQQDIAYEKLSRQLWTTKENAKEVDMALKTMGATMQDLWLSPTLLKQFTQLRKDSAALRLPKEYTDNLKVVQGIGLEFKRLKQLGELAFQWIGNYILKYAAGPLAEIKQGFKSFNDSLIENIPGIAKVIGTAIGVIARILLTVVKVVGFLVAAFTRGVSTIGEFLGKIPAPLQKIMKIIALIGLVIMTGPVGAVIALIAALDDLFTFMRGGKSVIGSFFEGLFGGKQDKKTLSNVGTKVKDYSNNTKINTVPSSYATNNTSNNTNTTSNSNNKISNQNTFNVYGGKDANSTAKVVSNKVNGLNTRNMQGVLG